ncbi:MAG: nucleotidyltransferase domain-containing protein [Thermodesulfovibrionales bacterium]
MKRDEIIKTLKDYFQQKHGVFDIEMAFLYGSLACGHPVKESDIDIAITCSERDEDKVFNILNNISLELTDLLKHDVNVIYIDNELSKPMLHYNAIVYGIPVFMKDFEGYVHIRLKAISQMEDFIIFGTKWQAEIVKRRLETISHD